MWIEKEALAGVFQRVCQDLDVPCFLCRGYTSQSEMWAASQRIIEYENAGQEPIILHFGDHDPSGIDINSRHYRPAETFRVFRGGQEAGAINMNQSQAVPNPTPIRAKTRDSQFSDYAREHGRKRAELDALEPKPTYRSCKIGCLHSTRDADLWEEAVTREKQARQQIRYISDNYDQITAEASE